ncbi:hypothetical protein [Chlamydia serpentis]|nr:hypothetical protein [Chlamydia serpentis]
MKQSIATIKYFAVNLFVRMLRYRLYSPGLIAVLSVLLVEVYYPKT